MSINKLLKIESVNDENIEILDFIEIISNHNPEIIKYYFSITIFDGMPNNKFKGSFMDLYNQINDDQFLFDYSGVKDFFLGTSQIFDLLLLIDKENSFFKKYSIEEEKTMYENIYLTIAYFDGFFWEISCKDDLLINKLKNKFIQSEIINI
ncbi:hypothetical protein [Elizabethkingia anophelis]|uniref:Uncharacterized protein n=1 Tax=Elizabethkingia anophelis NUHP1 TaxID=1338011 RepID=A0A077EB14_9FLAO|nr:hypothetical protein [Elizabethkingia anophelis]AIL44622.1 hypothetical protein BD94_0847 [Elizabethkingia anophelis NUHP1]MBE9394005.1 hypothetical protein [Elizabethkingia anophelis]MBE9408595.1 hypothetical protein [Elizabethkingia anophelis]BBQ08075.1 hypothetical protein JUNP353_2646 [Elizabethkingia anophelis]